MRRSFVCQEILKEVEDGPTESIWVKIREGRTKNIVAGVCYNSPDQKEEVDAVLLKQLDRISKQYHL